MAIKVVPSAFLKVFFDIIDQIIFLSNLMSLVLGYWGIRGRGNSIKYLLEYTGAPYEVKTYSSPEEWFGKDKVAMASNPYVNLPYLKDGSEV